LKDKLEKDLEDSYINSLTYYRNQIGFELPREDQEYCYNYINDFQKLEPKSQKEEFHIYESCIWNYVKSKI
jgi:hypothetical protein